MFFGTLLMPDVWLMRRTRLAGKLMLVAAFAAVPVLVAGYRFVSGEGLGILPADLMLGSLEGRAKTLVQSVASFRLQQGSAEEAFQMLKQAVSHRSQTTREVFLRDLTNPAKGFHDGDMYIFVLDARGTFLAFGGNPSRVGTRVQDIAGIDGNQLLESIVSQASAEPGWVE